MNKEFEKFLEKKNTEEGGASAQLEDDEPEMTATERAFQKSWESRVFSCNLLILIVDIETHRIQLPHAHIILLLQFKLDPPQEEELIKKKVSQSHRSKIEAYNEYLSKLTEHYDIPRVTITRSVYLLKNPVTLSLQMGLV